MTEIIKGAVNGGVKQVPALAALIILVMFGIRSMNQMSEAHQDNLKDFQNTLKTIGDSCHAVQRETTKALILNSEAMGKTAAALENNTRTLTVIRDKLERMRQ